MLLLTSGADISQPAAPAYPSAEKPILAPLHTVVSALRYNVGARHGECRQDENFGAPNVNLEDYTVLRFACEYRFADFFSVLDASKT